MLDNITSRIEAFAQRENGRGLYRTQGHSLIPEVHTLHLRSQAVLWHKRLGHFHEKGMQRMIASGAVKGLPTIQVPKQTCERYKLGKHTRTKILKLATFQASQILELIHSDVCGPFRICSTGGARYFVTFTDDFSRIIWVYFISQKDQVLDKFKHFLHSVENLTGKTVKALCTDNGGEYTSHAFSAFCSQKGITHERTPPYTPQRNDIAERRNRSLLDITRCLLLEKGLPGHLWAEIVKAEGDILNLRSTKRYPDKTPTELFLGKKPTIAHLRIFGSSVFTHVSKPSRTKLDPRAEKCILLSFDETAKAYRCYRPSTKKSLSPGTSSLMKTVRLVLLNNPTFHLPHPAAPYSHPPNLNPSHLLLPKNGQLRSPTLHHQTTTLQQSLTIHRLRTSTSCLQSPILQPFQVHHQPRRALLRILQ